jgi:hypothetical protein
VRKIYLPFIALIFPTLGFGQSPFDGTWRPDPQRASPTAKPDEVQLRNGEYTCNSCEPPYTLKADGKDQSVTGSPYYDTLNITVLDAHTVLKVAKKGGQTIATIKAVVAADGSSKTETQTITGMMPATVEVATTSSRVAAGPPGSHAISGQWREIQTDLTHHDEDTTYRIQGNTLTMSDRMGRSFSAKLDGTDAPYQGDAHYASVALKLIDSRTLEESDKKNGKIVQVNRWSVDPDGQTIHARFDDTHGHIQEQVGHKLKFRP